MRKAKDCVINVITYHQTKIIFAYWVEGRHMVPQVINYLRY